MAKCLDIFRPPWGKKLLHQISENKGIEFKEKVMLLLPL
jgi:hypothetical protein